MEKGTADSMRIVAILVYILDTSGESVARVSARTLKIRKQIIEVTTTFKHKLNANHGTARRAGLPFS
jgi:hypothetical protein